MYTYGMIEAKKTVEVTHINIRQSISFLILKLILLDLIFTLFSSIFTWSVSAGYLTSEQMQYVSSQNEGIFFLLIALKIISTLYVVLQWLNEYYEIYPHEIRHRNGIIWKKENHYPTGSIRGISLDQGIAGQILNYGTITLFDYPQRQLVSLYLIHNPRKYFKIMEKMFPSADLERSTIRGELAENDA